LRQTEGKEKEGGHLSFNPKEGKKGADFRLLRQWPGRKGGENKASPTIRGGGRGTDGTLQILPRRKEENLDNPYSEEEETILSFSGSLKGREKTPTPIL